VTRPAPFILALFLLLANGIPAQDAKEFYLQLRHDQTVIGPFVYKPGEIIEFQGARFQIGKTGPWKGRESFSVISDKTRKLYGPFVYERGREVRLGPFAFEISDPKAQIIQIVLPGPRRELSLAEVEVFSGGTNVALRGVYKTEAGSSTGDGNVAARALDGDTNGHYNAGSLAHVPWRDTPKWYVDLKRAYPIDKIVVWSRTDCCSNRLEGFVLNVLDKDQKLLWTMTRDKTKPIETSMEIIPFR
jgi:hypothetical protein